MRRGAYEDRRSGEGRQLGHEHDGRYGDEDEEDDDGENGGWPHRSADDTAMTPVRFLTREGCSLCAAALPLVGRRADRLGLTLEVVDVDGTAWEEPYGDRLPVVIIGDRVVLEGRFGGREVRRALRRAAR